jgi:hypothetical protein
MCIYDIQFAYGDEVLRIQVKYLEEAFQELKQLEEVVYQTTFAESDPSGKIEAKVVNVPPNEIVQISMKFYHSQDFLEQTQLVFPFQLKSSKIKKFFHFLHDFQMIFYFKIH